MNRVHRSVLANGLRLAVVPIADLRSTSVLLAVEAGQWFEPVGRPGIARLVAQTMLRGTARRDAAAWASELDALGAVARLDVGAHAAVFSAQCLGDDLSALLALIADVAASQRRAIASDGAMLVIAGGTTAEAAKDAVGRAFGDWPRRAKPRDANYPQGTLATAKRRVELVPNKTQSDVIIGWPGLPR